MSGFFGDPTKLFIKPEKPDFFLSMLGILLSLVSSEYRLGGAAAPSILDAPGFSLMTGRSVAGKVAD